MSAVPSGIIFAWPSTVASIPAGWSRETTLDSSGTNRYPHIATGDTAGTTGGNAGHSHGTSATHGHVLGSHTHTVSAAAAAAGLLRTNAAGYTPATTTHTHGNSTSASSTDTITAANFTCVVTANMIPTMGVIWIASDGTSGIPDGAYAYFDGSTLPTGWTQPTGDSSPVGRFLCGAQTDGDGGYCTDPYTTHTHSLTHGHTTDGHVHASTNSAVNTGTAVNTVASSSGDYARDGHVHAVTLNSKANTLGDSTDTLSAEDGFPKWEKLLTIENSTGSPSTPAGVIGLWLGAIGDIPANWVQKTSTQDFILGATDATEIGDTGGSDQHNHDDIVHTHTLGVHKHSSFTALDASSQCGGSAGAGSTRSASVHTHVWTCGNSTAESVANGTLSWSNCTSKAAYPKYTEVVLVKKLPTTTAFLAHAGI